MADAEPYVARRSNSSEFLPPKMSESPRDLRIVLLGRSVSGKSAVGNIILNTEAFNHDDVQHKCIKVTVEVEGRLIAVINTPDLLDPDISGDRLSEELSCIKTLSEPGPHVFLLVLQPELFQKQERNRIRNILNSLSDYSFDHSMVLTIQKYTRRHSDENKALNLMIQDCGGRLCLMDFHDHNHLMTRNNIMTRIDQMDNKGHVTLEVIKETTRSITEENRLRHRSKTDGILKSSSKEDLANVLEHRDSAKPDNMETTGEAGFGSIKERGEEPPNSGRRGEFQRCNSAELSLPNMSSLRIVLLGKSDDKKKTLGNIILQKNSFKAPLSRFYYNTQECESATEVNDKSVTVIKTPDLFSMSVEFLMMEMEKCKSLTDPGPHVLLLVLKPEEFTEGKKNTLKWILSLFGKEAFRHSMVIITHKGDAENPHLNQIIAECGGRIYHMDLQGSDHKEITGMIEKMVRENDWRYLTYNEEMTHDIMTPKGQRLNLVLCGSSGAGKTSVSNALLGQTESMSSSVCVKREGEICGQLVSIIEMPALYLTHLTQEEVMRESFRCVSLCDPGVHVFLLVVPVGPLTDEDKGEMETFQNILGPQANDFTMVLFSQEYITVDKKTVDFVEQNEDTKKLIKSCGGRYNILDSSKIKNNKQVTDLLADLVKMRDHNSFYTPFMYVEEQNRSIVELKVKISNMSQGAETECSIPESLRVVLIGKTCNGKSASANTILGREEFLSEISSDSTTTVCQKGICKLYRRALAVVDTPGLFDTQLSNKDVQKEIGKCVSLSAPGPHVFIIVLRIGTMTPEEKDTLKLIEETFGPRAGMFSLVLFTRGDDLGKMSIQDYIKKSKNVELKKLIRDCGDRFHVFNNKDKNDRTQVTELFKKIDKMVSENKGAFYTSETFQEAEASIKQRQEEILKEKELEIKADMEKLKVQHETEMEKIKSKLEEQRLKVYEERELREKMLREREEVIRVEYQEKEKKEKEERSLEDDRRKEQELLQKIRWKEEKEKMEKEIHTQKGRLKKQQRKKDEEYKVKLEKQREQEKEREELLKEKEKLFADLKRKQEEEIEMREKEELERKKNEDKQRQEWQRKIEDAEKGQTEMQEVMLREKQEWEEQLKKERERQQEVERLRRQKETETIKQQEEEQRRLREEFERERERDRIKNQKLEKKRRETEQKERDRLEKEFEEKKKEWINKMSLIEEDWERQRREEWERRHQEDLKRRKEEERRLKELEEHFRQEREEENMRREKEDQVRREQEEKKLKEMKAEYERKSKDMRVKYEEEARSHAEEFNNFREKYEEMKNTFLEEHEVAINFLRRKHRDENAQLKELYGHDRKQQHDKIKELEEKQKRETEALKQSKPTACVLL